MIYCHSVTPSCYIENQIGDCHCSHLFDYDCDYHIYNQQTLSAEELILRIKIPLTRAVNAQSQRYFLSKENDKIKP